MSNAATTAPINPREQRTIREHPVLHLRGPLLVGPQQEIDEAWVVGGRLHHQRPELPAGTELLEIDGFVVPGLADLHCHLGISNQGTGTTLPEARAQALTDRDTGVLLIRDAGSIDRKSVV